MLMFALCFRALSVSLEISRLLLLSLLGPVPKSESAEAGVPNRRFYFDLRTGDSMVRDNVGACTFSADDALADAIEAAEEFGEDIAADEVIVRDEDGHEVGRIDLSQWRSRPGV
jgi:hypothetical protein